MRCGRAWMGKTSNKTRRRCTGLCNHHLCERLQAGWSLDVGGVVVLGVHSCWAAHCVVHSTVTLASSSSASPSLSPPCALARGDARRCKARQRTTLNECNRRAWRRIRSIVRALAPWHDGMVVIPNFTSNNSGSRGPCLAPPLPCRA
jgi:hypothetical protein